MKDDTKYECVHCHGIFMKAWSDEEALADLNANFPGVSANDCKRVCEDCYKLITGIN